MRKLLVIGPILAVLTLLAAACGGGEGESEATATPSPTGTTVASPTATTRATATATAIQTPRTWGTPVATAVPTSTPGQVGRERPPEWQTSAPREPVSPGETVTLGIRNKFGLPGENYPIGVQVNLPDGTPVNMEGQVSGDEWTDFSFGKTGQVGTYTVLFGLPNSDLIYADDSFVVESAGPPPGTDVTTLSWQTSAPREPLAPGEEAELGLRNKYGEPSECYDFLLEIIDPVGGYAFGEDTVCGDEWTYLYYSDTYVEGIYDVTFSIDGQVIAQDSFEVVY